MDALGLVLGLEQDVDYAAAFLPPRGRIPVSPDPL